MSVRWPKGQVFQTDTGLCGWRGGSRWPRTTARRQKRTTALIEMRVELAVPPELCRPT
jgi:hypothetical protein